MAARLGWVWVSLLALAWAAAAVEVPENLRKQLYNVELVHSSTVRRRNAHYGTLELSLDFFNKTFDLLLTHHEDLFMFPMTAVEIGADGIERPFGVDRENYWEGTVVGDPDSYVNLYISPKGSMLGRIHTDGEVYVLEHSHRHFVGDNSVNPDEYTVVYRASDLINKYDPHSATNASGHSFCGVPNNISVPHEDTVEVHHDGHEGHDHPSHFATRPRGRRNAVSSIYNYCLVAVISDSQYFANNGGTTALVTSLMLSHLSQADSIFSSTSWSASYSSGVSYTNLHLSINKIIVYSSTGTDPYYSASGYTGTSGPQSILSLFSSAPGQSGGWSGSCVAHLFTYYTFTGGVLGLAWVGNPASNSAGGVCHSSPTSWLNTGWTTGLNNGNAVPTLMDQLVTTHEIGHNWGSPHDTAGVDCLGDDTNGHYLMYPTAVDGSLNYNKKFSPCSIHNITLVLASKGTCFTSSPSGFCGDFTVNNGEQCDAGLSGDACCGAAGASNACKLNASIGATCSDSSAVCCHNCKPSANTSVCFTAFLNDPQCRANAYCDGSSTSCPNPPPKKYGEPCGSGGFCSGASATAGACLSLCSRFGASSCKCSSPDECHVCCQHNPNATNVCGSPFAAYNTSATSFQCVRASVALTHTTNITCLKQPYWSTTLNTPIYYNATQNDPACTSSTCWNILDYVPNTVCSLGVCDTTGSCVAQSSATADSPWDLSSLSLSNVEKWMKQNIVGTVLIFSFVVWLPLGCLVHRYDLKQRQKNAMYGLRKSSAGTFRPRSDPGKAGR